MTEEIIMFNKSDVESLEKAIKRLEQENKELKIYIESNKQQVEEVETLVMDNNRLQQEVENLKDVIYYDIEKYRSALEEIKNMIIYCEEEYCCDRCKYHDNCCIDDDKFPDFSKALVNKINEVLNP